MLTSDIAFSTDVSEGENTKSKIYWKSATANLDLMIEASVAALSIMILIITTDAIKYRDY